MGRPLAELLDWLTDAAPEITAVELGSGGYAPHPHCDPNTLLQDQQECSRWHEAITGRGFAIAALNAWGNPLHPDAELARRHDRALRDTIRLAAATGVERVVAMAGCPAAGAEDRTPHFAGGGWLPYLEGVYEQQWERAALPYWSALSEFARAENPDLLICLELHPGTIAHNAETFLRLAALGANLAANLDPSHFFWQQMDPEAVIGALGGRIGHAHAKDLRLNPEVLALTGLLDRRWPGPSSEVAWSFATVGRGHDTGWWADFAGWLEREPVLAIAIEHEDPDVPAEVGVVESSRVLAEALRRTPARGAQ